MGSRFRTSPVCKGIAAACLLAPVLLTVAAQAQEGAAVHVFEPTGPGDRFRAVPDATVHGDLEPWVGWSWDYAYRPRGLSDRDEGSGLFGGAELFTHLGASLALWDRVSFDLAQPLRVASTQAMSDEGGFSFVDTRLGARGTVWSTPDQDLAAGAGLSVWLPTGSETEGTGDGASRLHLRAIVSGAHEGVDFTTSLGWLMRKKADVGNLTVGPAVTFGAGAAVPLADGLVHVGPEIFGHVVMPNDEIDTGFSRSMPIEGLATARVRVGSFLIGGLLGTGLTTTPGTARLRAELSLATIPSFAADPPDSDGDGIRDERDACSRVPGVAHPDPSRHGCPLPPPPPPDRDEDGIVDERDACADVAGVAHADPAKHGCPPDRDGDGFVDGVDACPDTVGVASDDPAKHGCLPDADGDGVIDSQDACADVPGVASEDPARNGCPPDRDGDGILDDVDACPDAAGEAHEEKEKSGCPRVAIVVDEIRITEKVHFATRSARILPESDGLLEEIARLLRDHPEILLVSIEGHTDSRDNDYYNKQLSTWRAAAVRRWLVERGKVEPKRLTSEGFGEDRPIASNDTEEGMARNRRVEFLIKQRAPKPDAAEGPAP